MSLKYKIFKAILKNKHYSNLRRDKGVVVALIITYFGVEGIFVLLVVTKVVEALERFHLHGHIGNIRNDVLIYFVGTAIVKSIIMYAVYVIGVKIYDYKRAALKRNNNNK